MNIPRPEYPRPQLERADWLNLNGEWEFELDNAKCGEEKKYFEKKQLSDKIIVPFCPESKLSGIGNTDFMSCVWYKRTVQLTEKQLEKAVILNFGAVDYLAKVFVNGKKVGEHKGGFTPFSFDITSYLKVGVNDITVCAYDEPRSGKQPLGKQAATLKSQGCFYTRVTGIWQTVWLEFVDKAHILSADYLTDSENKRVTIALSVTKPAIGGEINTKILLNGKTVGKAKTRITSNRVVVTVDLDEISLWDIGEGNLYDVKFTLTAGDMLSDEVNSYFGIRTIALDEKGFLLNGRRVFGRWVLDQGYYPDGIYTAPTEEALKNDILYSMELGFNGARLHQKVFEPRFLYWADKIGYPVWGEYGSWGVDIHEMSAVGNFLPEWLEAVKRDKAHPSIIGWMPFNETWDTADGRRQCDDLIKLVYETTKALDPERIVIDTSGNFHVKTDIFDVHNYEQNPEKLKADFSRLNEGIIVDEVQRRPELAGRQQIEGGPLFVSEMGGIGWNINPDEGAWGYGSGPKSEAEFIKRYEGLINVLLDNPDVFAFCYTQLYDIEQEQNGLMTYERKYKFPKEVINKINQKRAAIEEI